MFRITDFRPLAVAVAVGLGATACNQAESRNAPDDTEAATAPSVPAGTSMTFTVDDDVASDDFKPGDTFTTTLGADVADVEGHPILEAGTKARWTVTDAVGDEDGAQGLVAARLESVQVDDDWQPVQGTITDATLAPADTDDPADQAQTVKTGTEAEALIAQMSGTGNPSTMTQPDSAMAMGDSTSSGMAMGADNGPATIAVTNAAGPAHIDSGTRITLRLSNTLVLRKTDKGETY